MEKDPRGYVGFVPKGGEAVDNQKAEIQALHEARKARKKAIKEQMERTMQELDAIVISRKSQ